MQAAAAALLQQLGGGRKDGGQRLRQGWLLAQLAAWGRVQGREAGAPSKKKAAGVSAPVRRGLNPGLASDASAESPTGLTGLAAGGRHQQEGSQEESLHCSVCTCPVLTR